MGHETSWNAPPVRNTKASSHRDAQNREAVPDGRRHLERQLEIGRSVVSHLQEEGTAWASGKTERGTSLPLIRIAERKAEANPVERIASRRLFHRPMDLEPNWGRDSQTFWRSLPNHSRLARNVRWDRKSVV